MFPVAWFPMNRPAPFYWDYRQGVAPGLEMCDAIAILRGDGPIVFLGTGKLAAYEDGWIPHAVPIEVLGNPNHDAVNEHAPSNSRCRTHLPTIVTVQVQGHVTGRSPVIKHDIHYLKQLAPGTMPGSKSLAIGHRCDPNREQPPLSRLQRELHGNIIDTGIRNNNGAVTGTQAALVRDKLTQARELFHIAAAEGALM